MFFSYAHSAAPKETPSPARRGFLRFAFAPQMVRIRPQMTAPATAPFKTPRLHKITNSRDWFSPG